MKNLAKTRRRGSIPFSRLYRFKPGARTTLLRGTYRVPPDVPLVDLRAVRHCVNHLVITYFFTPDRCLLLHQKYAQLNMGG